ncbi:protein-L-isoaspartate(D-aspartate) O-methyltransferase [Dongia mobilis]|uniref:Protein-L-isoaspartate O-methyltransferase n=1 Tax=Dongia mobilis TaxID=578943 RepID=A0A4R6WD37_9PROT|nr:protein-L-isoaspartate(D-aspartate) O-methyltransferase [Dongia mobilis]TDQ77586.1 protein-L-isoaspartate(D-aspartate) O-methyltransferase [Dongia mobilis]
MSLHARKIRMIMNLRRAGLTDGAVLNAIERVPRELFVLDHFHDQAYEDQALPISHGQTISQPQIVAMMTEALEVRKNHKVLEIGTGSGYQAAVLSKLCRRVYTIERYKSLLAEAEQRFHHLRLHNITSRCGDGSKGWPEQAPFDRIIVTAAAAEIPQTLADQLAIGGIMVIPVGPERGEQVLVKLVKNEDGSLASKIIADVRFVPLVAGALPEGEARTAARRAEN